MSFRRAPVLPLILLLVACTSSRTFDTSGDPERMMLVPSESSIYFIGIKNDAVAVPGSFTGLTGQLDIVGHRGHVELNVSSTETGDEERDLNLITHLFGGADFPIARFDIKDAIGATRLPEVGESIDLDVIGILHLHGIDTSLEVPVRLTRQADDRIRIETAKPFILTKEQLGLQKAFDVLKAICGHKALSGAVPIQLDLVFAG
jgi:hypothetical protein